MGNHWHLVLLPRQDEALGEFMRWIGVTHVRRHHEHYQTRGGGHLYQGRFKSFPVQNDDHFLTVCRYVEANAARAHLVQRAGDWKWGGLSARKAKDKPFELSAWPVDMPANWGRLVDERVEEQRLAELRVSVNRGRPFGSEAWVQRTAKRLGLMSTLRNAGRPRKQKGNPQ